MAEPVSQEALDRAAAWLRAWDSQGVHRTGTEGDAAGANWIAAEAEKMGFRPVQSAFAFDRVDPIETYLDVDGRRFAGVPVFDAPGTEGIEAPIGPDGIEIVPLAPSAVYSGEYRRLRTDARHRALVVLCQGTPPGMGLLNAEQFGHEYGAPAIHIDDPAALAFAGRPARVVSRRNVVRATAHNVVVDIGPRDSALPPLVVMTPRSSWWQSTAERGGGLVCFLECLRTLSTEPIGRRVVLTANSGHELGHLGLDAFLADRVGWDRPGGAVWVHFGANIGATGGELSLVCPDDGLRATMLAGLEQFGRSPESIAPKTQIPFGETRDIHKTGGIYTTLIGTNPWFHLPSDRWPHTVSVADIARIGCGVAGAVAALAAGSNCDKSSP